MLSVLLWLAHGMNKKVYLIHSAVDTLYFWPAVVTFFFVFSAGKVEKLQTFFVYFMSQKAQTKESADSQRAAAF